MTTHYQRAINFQLHQIQKFAELSKANPRLVQSLRSSLIALEALRMIQSMNYEKLLELNIKENQIEILSLVDCMVNLEAIEPAVNGEGGC